MSSIDTSQLGGALPQRRRDDTSQAFIQTSNISGTVGPSYQNYLGPAGTIESNGLNHFNGASPFQTGPQYQQDYYGHSSPFNHPSSYQSMGNSLSPSTINDHLSPENFMSDGSMNGFSNYSTPAMDDSLTESQFGPNMSTVDDSQSIPHHFDPSTNPGEPLFSVQNSMNSSTIYPGMPILAQHLPSPSSSHRPSPSIHQNAGFSQPSSSTMYAPSPNKTFPIQGPPRLSDSTASHQDSSVFTGSSAAVSSIGLCTQNPHLVVTTEDCLGENVESSRGARRSSNISRGSKRSQTHLSPYPDEDSSDDELESNQQSNLQTTVERSADGAWLQQNTAGQAGIKPESRPDINLDDMPTLDEIEEERLRGEKNADVAEWLSYSDVGSGAEGAVSKKVRRKKTTGRRRAKSTDDTPYGDASHAGYNPIFDQSLVPGPGLYLHEPSEMGEADMSESEEDPDSPHSDTNSFEGGDGLILPLNIDEGESSWQGPEQASASEATSVPQGITANIAITRYREWAKEMDNASLAATIGSRRRSESDIVSVVGSTGISKLLLSPTATPTKSDNKGVRRRGSFLNNILPNRNNSNKLKRKTSQTSQLPVATASSSVPKEAPTTMPTPQRMGSFGRPNNPKIDTSFVSPNNENRSPNVFLQARQIFRSRSRSDLGKLPKSLGLAELLTQHGGPPMPTLASPLNTRVSNEISGVQEGEEDSGDDEVVGMDGIAMDLSVNIEMLVIPTNLGFKDQARQLNPRLADFLLERITKEQLSRYKRLIDLKVKHAQAVATNSCATKEFCFASGGHGNSLPPRAGNKDPDTTLVGFQILGPGMTEESLDNTTDGQTVAAQFPSGVPLPPVQRLPAEFECPLCFKIKKFYKPSDWTKHVHEDVQPFTCTFTGCNEPKSFKRKADWVRHENERHRQLEYWTCNIGECSHTCYRRDNFVQHLVREHKVPEPKQRTGRNSASRSPITPLNPMHTWQNNLGAPHMGEMGIEDVLQLVDSCHHESTKQPKDEPCKFCGNICTTWKKLTVHLAKHMEQISMPVLSLVERNRGSSVTGPSMAGQQYQEQTALPTKSLGELPTFLCDEPVQMDMDPQEIDSSDMTSNTMHSYPPFQSQMNVQSPQFSSASSNYGGSSYPPPSVPARSRAASFNDASNFSASRQGTTYPPAGFSTQLIQTSNPSSQYNNGQQYFFQSGGGYVAEPMSNAFLTPTAGTPASMGYSPEGSVADLQQTYSFR